MSVTTNKRQWCCRFGSASAPGMGQGVTVYTIDSGVRATHQEFMPWAGGASRASYGCAYVFWRPRLQVPLQDWVTM